VSRFVSHSLMLICAVTLAAGAVMSASAAHSLKIHGNRITLDGKRVTIIYRACGDLDGDGKRETVMSACTREWDQCWIVVARRVGGRWRLVTQEEAACYLRTDVTDVNGDGKLEIVARTLSGDGHGLCTIYRLDKGRLVELGHFSATKFRDLDGDGIPEVLSVSPVSFMFVGDHWLTIYKWNGQGYTEVSRRFPRMYDRVIRDLRRVTHDLQFTKDYGSKSNPHDDPELFADLYYYLGKAFEYRGLPAKAKIQYAIAHRLDAGAAAIRRINAVRKP
jgi:hypothetical protein